MAELLAPEELAAHGRDLLVKASRVLAPDDPRVLAVRDLVARADRFPDSHHPGDGVMVSHLSRAVSAASDERYAQSRSFRNRLIRLSLMALAMLVLVLAALSTGQVTLEDSPAVDVDPLLLGSLVALFGAVGALITAVPPLSRVTGTWNPFSLPAYQMLLKVVLGPTFAIVGLLLLQADMVPGVVTAQMTTTDLLIWSLVFGAGQHMVTRLVDNRVAGLVSSDPEERTDAGEDHRSAARKTSG